MSPHDPDPSTGRESACFVAPQGTAVKLSPAMTTTKTVLTEREHRILIGIAAGKPYHQIAHELHRNHDNIRSQAARLFHKLGARDRAHAVYLACQHGLLGGGE